MQNFNVVFVVVRLLQMFIHIHNTCFAYSCLLSKQDKHKNNKKQCLLCPALARVAVIFVVMMITVSILCLSLLPLLSWRFTFKFNFTMTLTNVFHVRQLIATNIRIAKKEIQCHASLLFYRKQEMFEWLGNKVKCCYWFGLSFWGFQFYYQIL